MNRHILFVVDGLRQGFWSSAPMPSRWMTRSTMTGWLLESIQKCYWLPFSASSGTGRGQSSKGPRPDAKGVPSRMKRQ
jgi:hypothetical protein